MTDQERRYRVPDPDGVAWWLDGTTLGPLGQAAMLRIRETVQRVCGAGGRQQAVEDARPAVLTAVLGTDGVNVAFGQVICQAGV